MRKDHNPKKFLLIMAGVAVILLIGIKAYQFLYAGKSNTADIPYSTNVYQEDNKKNASPAPAKPEPSSQPSTNTPLPEQALLNVPFTSQAPLANWDEIHEETCEEASLLMVKHYIEGTKFNSPDQADNEIIDLYEWETANGYKVDVTTSEVSAIGKNKYGLSSGRIKANATLDDIKKEIAAGRPVIIPVAGKLLHNPNFRNGGPDYHMLVLKGYDQNGFIANDPGTRLGNSYRYSYDTIQNALHDWNPDNILSGGKNYLVFD